MLKEICSFRDKSYRVVQEDGTGGPWVQYNDPEEGPEDARRDPSRHFRALEAELVAALGELRRERRLKRRLEAEVEALRERSGALKASVTGISDTMRDFFDKNEKK